MIIKSLFQEGGIKGLYRGFTPTLTGMVPYAGFSFYCFEMLKFFCMKYAPAITCNKLDRNTGMISSKHSHNSLYYFCHQFWQH